MLILELGLPPTRSNSTQSDWKMEIEGAVAPDASGYTEPEAADLEAANVAAPPQSQLRRMFSAFIDLGSNR